MAARGWPATSARRAPRSRPHGSSDQLKRRAQGQPVSGVGVLVEDLSSGQVLFSRNAGIPRPPASVEKLYTTVAALNLLGPNARLQTAVLGTGALGPGGVWHGNLYLRGGGDPTFGDGELEPCLRGRLRPDRAELANQLRHAGIRRVTGHIFADESLFDTDRGGPGHPQPARHPGLRRRDERAGLRPRDEHGEDVAGGVRRPRAGADDARDRDAGRCRRRGPGTTPAGAVELAHVESPPLSVLVRLMDVPSDDLIADMLAKQLGARLFARGHARRRRDRDQPGDRQRLRPVTR